MTTMTAFVVLVVAFIVTSMTSRCVLNALLVDLTNHLDPQVKSQVFPLRVAKLTSKFALVSSSEHIDNSDVRELPGLTRPYL